MATFNLTIPIEPKGQQRPRFFSAGRFKKAYKDKGQKLEEAKIMGLLYGQAPQSPLEGALELEVVAYMPIPKSFPKWKQLAAQSNEIRPAKKPDWDNLAKQICDILNGVAWTDDAQIVGAMVKKFYSLSPRWEVRITEVENGKNN